MGVHYPQLPTPASHLPAHHLAALNHLGGRWGADVIRLPGLFQGGGGKRRRNIVQFPPREGAPAGCGQVSAGAVLPASWRRSFGLCASSQLGTQRGPEGLLAGQGRLSWVRERDSQAERSGRRALPPQSLGPPSPARPFSFHQRQACPARFLLWLKPISRPDFAAELDKGLVLTWFGFSKFNFLPCFASLETEAPLSIFLGRESQHLL